MKSRTLCLVTACLMALPMKANADYLYTFGSSNFGSVAFTVGNIIQADTDFTSDIIGFTTGSSLAISPNVFVAIAQTANFAVDGVLTDTGAVGTLQMFFGVLPTSVGSFVADFGVLEKNLLANPTLAITEVPGAVAIPEPGILALIGASIFGLLQSRRRRGV